MVDNENMVMPVVPMGGTNNGGFGNSWGGDGWWIILLFILLGNGGWGMGNFGGGWSMMNGMYEFPWLMTGQQNINSNTNSGFRDAMLNDGITSVRDGINGISTQLCGCCGDIQMSLANGFAGTTAAITGAQNALAQQLYSNQLADLERSFAAQTAVTAGQNAIQAQLAQSCCDNRLATESLRATVLQENCQDRYEAQGNARDIIANATGNTQAVLNAITSGIQAIKDDLCADRLDAERRENANLRTQLNMATLQASQTAQTAAILQGQAAEIDGVYNRLKNCPVGTVPVFGNQPIFTCPSQLNGCGCGCGA